MKKKKKEKEKEVEEEEEDEKEKEGKEEAEEEEEHEKHKEIEDEKDSVIKQNHMVKFFFSFIGQGKTDQQNRAVLVEFSSNSKSSQNI